jgi:hypothetical protein
MDPWTAAAELLPEHRRLDGRERTVLVAIPDAV